MSLPPETIKIGQCYLADGRAYPQVRQVVRVFPDRRLEYKHRPARPEKKHLWRTAMSDIRAFAVVASREIPCDWTPETDSNL